jgi:hypothetical protein
MENSSVIMNHVEDSGILGCNAVALGEWFPRIQQSHHCENLNSCMGNIFRVWYSGYKCHVMLHMLTNVSEECATSIFRTSVKVSRSVMWLGCARKVGAFS